MAKYYYNGVLLPELPADDLAKFPYYWIRYNGKTYVAFMGDVPWYVKTNGNVCVSAMGGYRQYELSGDSWNLSASDDGGTQAGTGWYGDAGGWSLVFSSHDLPNGSATATEIYFEGGDPVPEQPAHTHSYIEVVTTPATCTTAGVKTYTCECNDSYTEEIPATGHNFVNGVCTVCGAADPDYNGGENTDPDTGGDSGDEDTTGPTQPEVDGNTLPPIPADILASFPYAGIIYVDAGSVRGYYLTAAKSEFYFLPAHLGAGSDIVGTLGAAKVYQAAGESWVLDRDVAAGECYITVGETETQAVEICWANHDIYTVTSVDTSTGEFGTGRVYFPDSDPESGDSEVKAYRIQRSSLEAIADQVRRLYYSTTRMTPAQIESKLSYLNLELQEAYISPSTEEQTIYPDRGYYGFSKIVVEAVEEDSSGTGPGGGGTPGGGSDSDDPLITYPSLEDSELTYAQTMIEVPTGRYFYGNCPQSLPACPIKYSNQVLFTDGNAVRMYQCGTGFYLNRGSIFGGGYYYNITPISAPQICAVYEYNSETDSWKFVQEANYNYLSGDNAQWANHTILTNYDGSVYLEGTPPTPEMEYATTYAPTATEAMYTIKGDTMVNLGATVYQITGEQATTPEKMIEALNYYAALNKQTEEEPTE